MKTLAIKLRDMQAVGRWDIDYHLPAEGIRQFPATLLQRLDAVVDFAKDKRDPGRDPDKAFQYIDIAAVDATVGVVVNAQDVEGSEAPSRARKVVRAFDVLVSTCRPTRGAICVVPVHLHDQIASTAFSVLRPKRGVNPYYLQYALRLPSTLEQFRKWSAGSSYPAILDSDVAKTLIPVPDTATQEAISARVVAGLHQRDADVATANQTWNGVLGEITRTLTGQESSTAPEAAAQAPEDPFTLPEIEATLGDLPALTVDLRQNGSADELSLWQEAEAEGTASESA